MKITTIATWVPFPGFYGTWYDLTNFEENEIDYFYNEYEYSGNKDKVRDNIDRTDSYNASIEDFKNDVVERHCKELEKELTNILNCVVSIKNPVLISPRFYNFENDSINANVEIDLDAVIKYVNNNKVLWIRYCKDVYTSRDGFISHYDPCDFFDLNYEKIENSRRQHLLGAILNFIILNEGIEECIIESVFANCNLCYDYESIIKELKELGLLEEIEEN